jgi:hypothetical protein
MAIELVVNQYNSWTSETLFKTDIAMGAPIGGYYSGFEIEAGEILFNYGVTPIYSITSAGIRFRDTIFCPDSTDGSVNFTHGSLIRSSQNYLAAQTNLASVNNGYLSILQQLRVMKEYGVAPGIVFEDSGCGIGMDSTGNILFTLTDGTSSAYYKFGLIATEIPNNTTIIGDLQVNDDLTVLGDISVTGSAPWLTAETDPVFTSSVAYGITATDTTNWDTAYSWGDHATEGYLTAVPTSLNQNLSVLGDLSCSQLLTAGGGLSILDGEITMTGLSTLANGIALQSTMLILQSAVLGETTIEPTVLGAKTYLAQNPDSYSLGATGFISQTGRLIDSTADPDPDNITYHSDNDYMSAFAGMVFSDYVMDGTDITDVDYTVAGGMLLQASQDHNVGALGTRLIFVNTLNDTTETNVALMIDGDNSFNVYGNLIHKGDNLAFYDGTACSQPVVNNSGTTEQTLANVVSALESLNLISTTS